MKTSAVLASLLFGSFAVAAPVDKRALVYKTEVVTETVVVYTTVYDDNAVAEATTTPAGYFYEQPKVASSSSAPSSAAAKPTPQPAVSAPVEEKKPSVTPAPAPQVPTPAPAPSSSPAPVVEQPKPVEKPVETPQPVPSAAPAPSVAPAPSSAAPVPSASPAPSNPTPPGNGQTYTGDGTIYDGLTGTQYGACGTLLKDTDMIVALAKPMWGESTHDYMTGASTNPWCNQKISIQYGGKSVTATIVDLCPSCVGGAIDMSIAVWNAVTGGASYDRLKNVQWSKIA